MYLNSLKRKKESRKVITTADFETCVINNRHLVICYSIYDERKSPIVGIVPNNYTDIHLESNKLIKSFLDELFKYSKRELVYFHNGSKFDFMFGYFIAPKAYSFETYDDNNNLVLTAKMSGFPADQIDPKFIKNYFHDEINELTINRKFLRLFKEFAIYDIHIDTTTKRTNLKREKVYSNNIWTNYFL